MTEREIDESVHSGMEMLDYELSNRLFLTPVYLCMVNRLFLKNASLAFIPALSTKTILSL